MKKSLTKYFIFIIVFMIIVMPVFSFAAAGDSLVHCGITDKDILATHPDYAKACDFNGIMNLANTLIQFALFDLALPIVAIMFVFAGFELVTSGGSTEKRGIAKKVFTSAVIGFIIAMAGWLIVKTILTIMGYSAPWIGL